MAARKKKVSKKSVSKKKTSKKTASKKKASKTTASKKKTSGGAPSKSDMTPPAAVRRALKKGLELRGEYGGKGLVPNTITWARKLAEGAPITVQKARKMNAYFSRHIVDKRAGWDKPPTPGYVAWLLWGGDAARTWVKKVLKKTES